MRVKVQYFAIVRELVDQREEILEVSEKATVLDLLRLLAEKYGERFREYVFDSKSGNPRSYLQFLLDENSISNLDGFSTVLTHNCTFAIIPPVGGG